LDRLIFGKNYYAPGISKWAWLPSDPEGLWGYLTGFFNTYMGLIFSLIMQNLKQDSGRLTKYWLHLALSLSILGLFMNLEGMPLNKKMWSVSFMFFTSGFSGLSLVALYYIIDVIDKPVIKKIFTPFIWLGKKEKKIIKEKKNNFI
jgi:heparan-alpha-glucosaminide N-acetyltransferase